MHMLEQILVLQNPSLEYSWRSHSWNCFSHEKSEEKVGYGWCGKGCLKFLDVFLRPSFETRTSRAVQRGQSPGPWSGRAGHEAAEPLRSASEPAVILILPVCWTDILIFCMSHSLRKVGQSYLREIAVPWNYDGMRIDTVVLKSQGFELQMAETYSI